MLALSFSSGSTRNETSGSPPPAGPSGIRARPRRPGAIWHLSPSRSPGRHRGRQRPPTTARHPRRTRRRFRRPLRLTRLDHHRPQPRERPQRQACPAARATPSWRCSHRRCPTANLSTPVDPIQVRREQLRIDQRHTAHPFHDRSRATDLWPQQQQQRCRRAPAAPRNPFIAMTTVPSSESRLTVTRQSQPRQTLRPSVRGGRHWWSWRDRQSREWLRDGR